MKRVLDYNDSAFCQHEEGNGWDCQIFTFCAESTTGRRWDHLGSAIARALNVEPDDFWRGRLHIIVEVEDSDPHP